METLIEEYGGSIIMLLFGAGAVRTDFCDFIRRGK